MISEQRLVQLAEVFEDAYDRAAADRLLVDPSDLRAILAALPVLLAELTEADLYAVRHPGADR